MELSDGERSYFYFVTLDWFPPPHPKKILINSLERMSVVFKNKKEAYIWE